MTLTSSMQHVRRPPSGQRTHSARTARTRRMHRERRVTGGAPGHFALGPFALSAASEPLRWLSAAMMTPR
jgi:hypothetical protein